MDIVLSSELSRIRRQLRVAQSERQDIAASPYQIHLTPQRVQEPYGATEIPLFYACHPYMIIDKGSHVSSSLVASPP